MVSQADLSESLKGRRVLVTGHTGFKGAWLSLWLEQLGAQVIGLSLPPEEDSLYARAGLSGRWPENLSDIRSYESVEKVLANSEPDLVFHLAAQPIVSVGYRDPMGTFEANVLGTMHVLEAARRSRSIVGCVVITTDKVYRPWMTQHRHIETDPLGASDPYSASKAAAEHVISAWRVMLSRESGATVVAARAGNVIGGGDFAPNRLMPDLIRAFAAGVSCEVRHPDFTRPWQHVLDPLSGYLDLGARMLRGESVPDALNFGPDQEEPVSVIADLAATFWGEGAAWEATQESTTPETPLLALSSELAHQTLAWRPTWSTAEAVQRTIAWWKGIELGASPLYLCQTDITEFMSSQESA